MYPINVKNLANHFKLLGDANRLAILRTLEGDERSVTEIINVTKLSQTLVSFHLRALREAGIVTARRQGPFINYRIVHPEMMDLIRDFCRLLGLEDGIANGVVKAGSLESR